MLKGNQRIFPALLSLAFLLAASACGARQASPAAAGAGAVLSGESHKLTQQQRLEDYDAMWKDIEDNYPLMGVAERTAKKDFPEIKTEYREIIASAVSDGGFWGEMNACLEEFKGCGHMLLFDSRTYATMLETYQSMKSDPHCAYLERILDNPVSRTFYRYQPGTDIYQQAEKTASAAGGKSGNIQTETLRPGKAAYLKIATFGSQYEAIDAPQIAEFFRQIQQDQNCVIDIRGNGGGADSYWQNAVVSSNLRGDILVANYELVRGEASKKYIETITKLDPISEFPGLPHTNPDDVKQMQYFIKSKTEYRPSGKPVFSGKFYLLVDGSVYSSSEAFAIFCKQTGFATLVGEPTGGDGIGTAPLIFALPNSGICFRFSASLGLNPDGGSNEEFGTQPDIPCKAADALQVCLSHIESLL